MTATLLLAAGAAAALSVLFAIVIKQSSNAASGSDFEPGDTGGDGDGD